MVRAEWSGCLSNVSHQLPTSSEINYCFQHMLPKLYQPDSSVSLLQVATRYGSFASATAASSAATAASTPRLSSTRSGPAADAFTACSLRPHPQQGLLRKCIRSKQPPCVRSETCRWTMFSAASADSSECRLCNSRMAQQVHLSAPTLAQRPGDSQSGNLPATGMYRGTTPDRAKRLTRQRCWDVGRSARRPCCRHCCRRRKPAARHPGTAGAAGSRPLPRAPAPAPPSAPARCAAAPASAPDPCRWRDGVRADAVMACSH